MNLSMTSLSAAARTLIDARLPTLPRVTAMLRASDAGDGLPELEVTYDSGAGLDALIGEVLGLRDELTQAGEEARRSGQ